MNKTQEDYLLKNYQTKSVEEMAVVLRLDPKAVRRELRRLLTKEAEVKNADEKSKKEKEKTQEAISPGWVHGLAVAGVLALTFAVYAKSLHYPFLNWDDPHYVTENRLIRGLGPHYLAEMFAKPYFHLYIPFTLLSYAVDFQFFQFNTFGYHLTNVLLHLANAGLVYALVFLVARQWLVALAVALVFGVHPVQIESVVWIAERKNVLSSLFFLLALGAYIKNHQSKTALSQVVPILLFLAACLSKPNVVVFPLLLVAYEHCFGRLDRKGLLKSLPYFAGAFVFACITVEISKGADKLHYHGGGFGSAMLAMMVVMMKYFQLLFFPLRQSLLYEFPVYPSIAHLPVALSFFGLVATAAGGVLLWIRDRRLFFWAAWYFVLLLPVMNLIPFPSLMNDRYLYLPMIGAMTLLFTFLRRRAGAIATGALLAAAVAGLLVLNVRRQEVWVDTERLWAETKTKAGESHVSFVNLGGHYLDTGEYDKAIAEFEKAIAVYEEPVAYGGLGIAYFHKGDVDKAIEYYQKAIARMPERASFHGDLALAYKRRGQLEGALRELQQAVALEPQNPLFRTNLGLAAREMGNSAEAEGAFLEALRIDPAFVYALYELGAFYQGAGRVEEARKHWAELVRLHPAHELSRRARSQMEGL